MNKVLQHHPLERVFVYLNNFLIVGSTPCALYRSRFTFEVGKSYHKREKGQFCLAYTIYLGYMVDGDCIQVDPEKVEAVTSHFIP